MNKEIIAITGASGYIGSRLTKLLKSNNHVVIALGRKPIVTADKNIAFALEEDADESSFVGVNTLIHCAYDFSHTDYNLIRKTNLEGSINLFKKACAAGVKNIIFISTMSAFVKTESNYGKIKYEIEKHAQNYGVVIVRPGLVFSRNAGGIVGALNNLVKKLPIIPLVGCGDQRFYPCHLDDLCALILFLTTCDHNKITSPIIAASERVVTFKEIILTLAQCHKKNIMTVMIPYKIVFAGLFFAELLHLKIGLRSDSLRYMKCSNDDVNFWFTKSNNILFRPFDVSTLCN